MSGPSKLGRASSLRELGPSKHGGPSKLGRASSLREHRSLRGRLTAVQAVIFVAAMALVLGVSYGLMRGHLLRTLPDPVARSVLDRLAGQYALALVGTVLLAVAVGWLVAGRLLAPLHASLESQRRFVANASHELRSPLTVIRTEADVTLGDPDATVGDLRRMGETVLEATDRLDALLDGLMVLAVGQRGMLRPEPLDLAAAGRRAAAETARTAAERGVRLELDIAPAPVVGDKALLGRLAGNLLDNAVRYNRRGGMVELHTQSGGGRAQLRVVNSGPMVPHGAVERLTEPFERLGRHGDGPGAGLGLSIVRAVAEAHGGQVRLSPRPEGGLDVTVELPAADAALIEA